MKIPKVTTSRPSPETPREQEEPSLTAAIRQVAKIIREETQLQVKERKYTEETAHSKNLFDIS